VPVPSRVLARQGRDHGVRGRIASLCERAHWQNEVLTVRFRLALGILLLGGAAYFALFGGEYNVLEVQRIRREYAAEQERTLQLEAEIARLRARVDSLQSDSATIERIARERWGLIRPGERLYRFEEGDPARDSLRRDTTTAPPDSTAPG
jgi:cell division protein FtsB